MAARGSVPGRIAENRHRVLTHLLQPQLHVQSECGETDEQRFDELSNIVLDHALLAEGSQLDNPAAYVHRMNKLLLDLGGANEQA